MLKSEYVFATHMEIMKSHFAFFENHIKPVFRKDTNTTIGDTLIALAYPQVILIGPAPYFVDAVVNVKKEGVEIEPDKYPLYRFLSENPKFCQAIIESHADLLASFSAWSI